jgi:hypothetical protein
MRLTGRSVGSHPARRGICGDLSHEAISSSSGYLLLIICPAVVGFVLYLYQWGVVVRLFRFICSSSLVGALFLLPVGCSSSTSSSGQGSPTSPSNASPSTEGTGLESPLASTTDANSISLPSLPPGSPGPSSANSDKLGCFHVSFLPLKPIPPGMVVTVTDVGVTGPFIRIDLASAGCPQGDGAPACAGWQLRTANSGGECTFGVRWDGETYGPDGGDPQGVVALKGTLNCPTTSRTACLQYAGILRDSVRQNPPATFTFEPGTATGSSSSSATGSSSSSATGSSSSSATGSSSSSATGSP